MVPSDSYILADVPQIENRECADVFTEALSIAASYGNEGLRARYPGGVYDHASGFSGRGWLIGFDEACFYWEKHDQSRCDLAFAVSGLEGTIYRADTLVDAVEYLGFTPEFVWNQRTGSSVAS